MVYRKFFIQTLMQVIFIVITCFVFVYFFSRVQGEYLFLISGIGFMILFQVYLLVRYVNKSNSDLTRLFNSIQNRDRTLYFPELGQSADKNLRKAFNRLINMINSVETENEKRRIYLQLLIDQIDIGIISFDQEGNVDLCNRAFSKLFHRIDVKHVHDLKDIQNGFPELLMEISPRKPVLKKLVVRDPSSPGNAEIIHLSIKSNIIQSGTTWRKIITCQNIIHELESNELDSWQKLIRVMTHEIMNSISPITSLSHKIAQRFKADNPAARADKINDDLIRKSLEGLNTIEETGKGLMEFVTKYRSITLIPPPEPQPFQIRRLFQYIQNLFREECIESDVSFITESEPGDLEVVADEGQMQKVLINLVKNSLEALKEVNDKKLELSAKRIGDNRIQIQVMDNGMGITHESLEEIFIPFYTTKERGSGIGLSVSRQIVRQNGGSIKVFSLPGEKTVFTVTL